ncbi:MAG: hypothetical protein Kow00121_34870 [Elainellaceae cyanobacterium]
MKGLRLNDKDAAWAGENADETSVMLAIAAAEQKILDEINLFISHSIKQDNKHSFMYKKILKTE